MTGDRLKILEAGFLEGSLSDKEEKEFRQLLADSPDDHAMKAYFNWVDESLELEPPELKKRLPLSESKHHTQWLPRQILRIAAALVLLATLAVLWNRTPPPASPTETYTELEIEQSYKQAIATLTTLSNFLNESVEKVEAGINIAPPFEDLDKLKNATAHENNN